MANYKHNKQGKLTEIYAGEPKTRVNMSLTAKALVGLDEMIASGLGNSRSDVVEKLGRGELQPYTHKKEQETPQPNTHKVKELLLEAQKVKASKKKGSVSRAWELVSEAIALLASSGEEEELPLFSNEKEKSAILILKA